MKILIDVTSVQKKKILEILKLTAVVEALVATPSSETVLGDLPTATRDTLPETPPLKIAEDTTVDLAAALTEDAAVVITRETVAAAVLARAKLTGNADAISIMEKVGGHPQLGKIPAANYPALVAALEAVPVKGE